MPFNEYRHIFGWISNKNRRPQNQKIDGIDRKIGNLPSRDGKRDSFADPLTDLFCGTVSRRVNQISFHIPNPSIS